VSKLARDNRNRDLGTIHLAKKELMQAGRFLSDDDYRAMLWTQARVRSAADLDHAGRRKVIEHLKSLGFNASTRRGGAHQVRGRLTPKQKLCWSLWQQLADANAVNDRTMKALAAYVARQTGVQRVEWLNAAQEDLVIESLKQWLGRLK
jgi:hypothetical protein